MSTAPIVTLAGKVIPGSWDGTTLVALDGLTIRWGRDSLFDETPPSTLSLAIIDPAGDWATNNNLVGQSITIARSDLETIIFRGRIADVDVQPVEVLSPITGAPVRVWRADLQCIDPLADLAGRLATGDRRFQPDGPGTLIVTGFNTEDPASRVRKILSQGANALVDNIEAPVVANRLGEEARASTRMDSEGLTFLELIQALYKFIPLARANYDPTTHSVVIGLPANNDGMRLTLSGGLMTIRPVSGLTIPANKVLTTTELTISSTVSSAIDAIKLDYNLFNNYAGDTPASVEVPTSRASLVDQGRRYLTITSDISEDAVSGSNPAVPFLHFALAAAEGVAELVDQVNGRFTVPLGLRLDLRRWDYDTATVALLLDPKSSPTPVYFSASILNPLANVGPMFQVIGGTITWHNARPGTRLPPGWVVEPILAPTTGTAAAIGIGDLVTSSTPTMADFDPLITMGDLGNVTIGLP